VDESTELDTRGEHSVAHRRDPMAEPSAEWGWHGTFPRTARIGGWATAAILLLMMIGNHTGRVEDLWLISLALLVVGMLVWDLAKRRTPWRR
jgi:hypothetical protein